MRNNQQSTLSFEKIFRFDAENSGCISIEEIKFVLKNLPATVSDGDIEDIINAVDPDGKGEIDLALFKTMIGYSF